MPTRAIRKGWRRSRRTWSTKGTGSLSAIDVSDAIARIGADYDVDVGPDVTDVLADDARALRRARRALLADLLDPPEPARGGFPARPAAAPRSAASAEGSRAGRRRARVPAARLRRASVRPSRHRQRRRAPVPVGRGCRRLSRRALRAVPGHAGHRRRDDARRDACAGREAHSATGRTAPILWRGRRASEMEPAG